MHTQLLFICLCPTTTSSTSIELKSCCLTVLWQNLTVVGKEQTAARLQDTEMDILAPLPLIPSSRSVFLSIFGALSSLASSWSRQPSPAGTNLSKTLGAKSGGKTGKIPCIEMINVQISGSVSCEGYHYGHDQVWSYGMPLLAL